MEEKYINYKKEIEKINYRIGVSLKKIKFFQN